MSCAELPPFPRGFLVTETARRLPDAAAIVTAPPEGGTSAPAVVTYRELDGLMTAVGKRLDAAGLRPGDRVALRLPAGASYPVLLMSLIRAGFVAAPLSARIPDAALPGFLTGIRCRHLISPQAPATAWQGKTTLLDPAALLRDASAIPDVTPPAFNPAGDATVVFTSGSTGRPRAALHSYANHWFSAAGSNQNIPFGPADRWLLALPLWHVGGLAILFRAFLGGGAVALPAPGATITGSLAALGITHLSLVPTQLWRLLGEPAGVAALSRLKTVLLGGSALAPSLIEAARREDIPVVTSYGSTEMSSQITATVPGGPATRLLSSGRLLPFREISIATDGEILARGETLFRGYLKDDGLDPARDPAGWFHTGDLGAFDAQGFLSVAGRRDTMFVSGGENIHPEEIERELSRHPGILEAIVVPVEDAEFGARPVAFVRGASEVSPGTEELGTFLRKTLPGFMVPDRFLPLPAAGDGLKPSRRELEDLARGTRPRGPER